MKAVIMAGGEGKRLRPLTCTVPKPMLPAANRPVIEYAVELLKKHGIHEIGFTLRYLPDIIKSHMGNGREYDAVFEYFTEKFPLGTAGSVKNANDFLSDTFVVMSGDGLTDIDITEALTYHKNKNADVTIVLKRVENPIEYGVVITREDGKIIKFIEKPSWGEVFSDSVNTGIYIINKNVMELVPNDKEFDFSHDLFPKMLRENMNIYGYVAPGYWCDIGDLKSYVKANEDAISGKVSGIDFSAFARREDGVFISKNAITENGAMFFPPCMVGNNTVIKRGSVIGPGTVIGDGCVISERTSIKHSVIHENTFVGDNCELKGCIVSSDCVVKDGSSLFEGTSVGSGTKIGEMCTLKNSASVWPQKNIEANCTVSENIIWQTAKYSGYFDGSRIHGKLNSHITNKTALISASAFSVGKKRILTARSSSPSAQMLYSAAKSGILSSGSTVTEIGSVPLPTLRYMVRLLGADGGVYIGEKNGIADIYFTDKTGADISRVQERQIESALNNDTVLPSLPENIKETQNFDKACEFYESHIISLFSGISNADNLPVIEIINGNSVEYDVLINILLGLGIKVNVTDFENCTQGENSIRISLSDYGEKLIIYDEKNCPEDKNRLNLLLNYIFLKNQSGERFVVADYNAPQAIDIIAHANNGTVIRTKSGKKALIEEIVKHDGIDDFVPIGKLSMYYDGIMFLLGLCNTMIKEGKTYKELMQSLPELHISEKEVYCPWNKRCEVLRTLSEYKNVNPGNGVKITQKYGWSLVLPDEKRAMFKIYSEAFSNEYADELTDICIKKINDIADLN